MKDSLIVFYFYLFIFLFGQILNYCASAVKLYMLLNFVFLQTFLIKFSCLIRVNCVVFHNTIYFRRQKPLRFHYLTIFSLCIQCFKSVL